MDYQIHTAKPLAFNHYYTLRSNDFKPTFCRRNYPKLSLMLIATPHQDAKREQNLISFRGFYESDNPRRKKRTKAIN